MGGLIRLIRECVGIESVPILRGCVSIERVCQY